MSIKKKSKSPTVQRAITSTQVPHKERGLGQLEAELSGVKLDRHSPGLYELSIEDIASQVVNDELQLAVAWLLMLHGIHAIYLLIAIQNITLNSTILIVTIIHAVCDLAAAVSGYLACWFEIYPAFPFYAIAWLATLIAIIAQIGVFIVWGIPWADKYAWVFHAFEVSMLFGLLALAILSLLLFFDIVYKKSILASKSPEIKIGNQVYRACCVHDRTQHYVLVRERF